jgi:hypothetical protein
MTRTNIVDAKKLDCIVTSLQVIVYNIKKTSVSQINQSNFVLQAKLNYYHMFMDFEAFKLHAFPFILSYEFDSLYTDLLIKEMT